MDLKSSRYKKTVKSKTDWGEELIKAADIVRRVFLRILTVMVNIVLTVLLIGILTGIIAGTAFAIYIRNHVDSTVDESIFVTGGTSHTTKLYYYDFSDRANRVGDPVEIEDQRLIGEKNSLWAPLSSIPKHLQQAFVSIEDKRFNDHKGVDWIRSSKAVLNFFLGFDSSAGGGSTITQQLIKNTTHYDDVTIQRKVQEMLMALNLEKIKTKDEILEMYLNIVPLSQRCEGVQAAANTYFNKDVSDLSLIECVCIASITNAPTRYDPVQNPENNAYRRNLILDFMLEFGCITEEEYEDAYTDIIVTVGENEKIKDIQIVEEKLVLNFQNPASDTISTNSWYTDTVISDVINDLVEQKNMTRTAASSLIWNGGLQIYTLMDPRIQGIMEEAFTHDEYFPANTSGVAAESAMCVCDPRTGDLLGVVGARGVKTENRILNFATQTKRPPGSSIKPLAVYGPAMQEGVITWATVEDDTPINFGRNNNDAWPDNLPLVYEGLINIKYSLATSKNTGSLKTLTALGLDTSFSYLKDKFKISTLVENGHYSDGSTYNDKGLAALGLGQLSHGATVREMTASYCVFPNKGVVNKCRSYLLVTDANGNTVLNNDYEAREVFSEQTAYIITRILENVVDWGTATKISLDQSIDVAGKTGTSQSDYDRWFMAYTPYYVGGVWYGYATPKTMTNELWFSPANRMWDIVMTEVHKDILNAAAAGGEPIRTWEEPANIVEATYCKDSGKLMTEACRLDPRGDRSESGYFVLGTEPTEYCDCHVIVEYDSVTGGIAHPGCPRDNITRVGLITLKEERVFPMQIAVSDAEFVYRDLPAGIRPAAYAYEPYFQGLIPAGVYCGVSGYWGATQFNRFCTEHFDYSKYDSRKLSSYHGVYAEKPSPLTTETAMLPQDDRRRREREAIV